MPTINLSQSADRERLEELIESDINNYCVQKYENGHRNHLGASELGKPCLRQLWYKFRWVKAEQFNGRMLRLFNVGHSAEPRFIDYLRGIGFEVKEFAEPVLHFHPESGSYFYGAIFDPGDGLVEDVSDYEWHRLAAAKQGITPKQFRISGVMGHYGGSLDGMCKAPARYQISEDLVFLNEFKTNNTGAGYNKVAEQHLSKAKPTHFDQMCQYGYHYKLKYGIYLIENKNDSDLTVKVVALDWNRGAELQKKAERVITATEPPERISENPAFFECSYCTFKGICHNGEIPEKSCRSCRMCSPVDNANWHCSRHNANIPYNFIVKGCDEWTPV